jgi:hypothetical protein
MKEYLDKIKRIESIANLDRVAIDLLIEYSHDDYAGRVLDKLTIDEHYEVIDRIYANVVGRLAYVCKETVRETTYFKP